MMRLLEKYKAIWTRVEDLKNIELNALPVHDCRYIKTKIRAYGDKVYTNFHGLNLSEDDMENLLQSSLLIFYLFMKTNIICKYI